MARDRAKGNVPPGTLVTPPLLARPILGALCRVSAHALAGPGLIAVDVMTFLSPLPSRRLDAAEEIALAVRHSKTPVVVGPQVKQE